MLPVEAESVAVVILTICLFLSFYFTYMSFQALDEAFKKQLVTFAALALITGIVIFACMTVYLSIKKAFSRIADQLRINEEASKPDD